MTTGRKFSDDEYALCPEELPVGMIDFIRQTVLPHDNTLIYEHGNVKGICFLCGREVRARRPKSFRQGNVVQCPSCGATVVCALVTGNHYRSHSVDNIIAAQKGADGETVFFRQFRLSRDLSGRWQDIENNLEETVRYAIRGKHIAKWQHEMKSNYFYHTERYALDKWERWKDNRIYDNGFYLFVESTKEALAGTAMQYADLEGYMTDPCIGKNSIYFLEFHARFPVIEFLWKRGYKTIVHEKISGDGLVKGNKGNAIRWQRTDLKECFKFPLRFLKILPPEQWTLEKVAKMNVLYEKRGEKLKEAEFLEVLTMKPELDDIKEALAYASVEKVLKYIGKQTKIRVEVDGITIPQSEGTVAHTFRDYIDECMKLQLNLRDKGVLFPKNLKTAHDRTMAQVRFLENKESKKDFEKVAGRLKKYTWQTDTLLIRAAESPKELSWEGQELHHCVGNYADRMSKGETAIFFIRRTDKPDKPFYTLELKRQRVVQCRTTHNKSYELEPEIKAFVDAWMQEVVLKGGKKQKENKEGAA